MVAELAARQHGAVARAQLRGLGFSDGEIDSAVVLGRLFPMHRFAYAVGRRDLDRLGQIAAAALACGEGAVVSHRTAAHLHGFWERLPDQGEVIAAIEAGRKIPGIKRRHVIPLEPGDAWLVEGIPCTSPARTMVDLAGILSERAMRRCVEAAAVRGLLDPGAIRAILLRRRRRGAPTLRLILEEWPAGAADQKLRSPLEAKMLAALNRAGIDRAATNLTLVISGRRIEVDFCWPRHRLIVEADGAAYHDNPIAQGRDRERDLLLKGAGYRVLRIRWDDLNRRPGETMAKIRRALSGSAVP